MAKFKITYADGSGAEVISDGIADDLFEQSFSHCSDDVKAKCKVELVDGIADDLFEQSFSHCSDDVKAKCKVELVDGVPDEPAKSVKHAKK